jgi:D-alanyl-D-alanine dipeptidase
VLRGAQRGAVVTAAAHGTGRKFDVTLLVRNLLNVQYGSLYDWNSYSPSEPRWVGVTVSARL